MANIPAIPTTKYHTYTKVRDHLFVGGYLAAENLELLRELGITTVIVIKGFDLRVKSPTIKYHHYKYADLPRELLHEKFDEIADMIEAERLANGITYVSCRSGISRSVSVILAYLIKYGDLSLRAAHSYLLSIRPFIDVNTYFMIKLVNFEARIRKSSSVKLIRCRGRWWPDLPGY